LVVSLAGDISERNSRKTYRLQGDGRLNGVKGP